LEADYKAFKEKHRQASQVIETVLTNLTEGLPRGNGPNRPIENPQPKEPISTLREKAKTGYEAYKTCGQKIADLQARRDNWSALYKVYKAKLEERGERKSKFSVTSEGRQAHKLQSQLRDYWWEIWRDYEKLLSQFRDCESRAWYYEEFLPGLLPRPI
jgi:hypothetical protein